MEWKLFFALAIGAALSYLIAGVNPAVVFSRLLHKQDIRRMGSGNPGFTNYKRCFGGWDAWLVFVLDLAKTVVPVLGTKLIVAHLFGGELPGIGQFAAALTGLFAMLGHAYPVWYRFQGGKAFVTGVATAACVDWRLALAVFALYLVMLLTVKIMSLSSLAAGALFTVCLFVYDLVTGPAHPWYIWGAVVLGCLANVLLFWRHRSNISRLVRGEEKKFYLFGKPKPAAPAEQNEEPTEEQTADAVPATTGENTDC